VIITTYMQASDFLARVRAELERNEVLNGLLLGITLHLQKFPERIEIPPYLATVEDEGKLIVAAVMTPPFRLIVTSNQVDAFGEAPSLLIHNLREHGLASSRRDRTVFPLESLRRDMDQSEPAKCLTCEHTSGSLS